MGRPGDLPRTDIRRHTIRLSLGTSLFSVACFRFAGQLREYVRVECLSSHRCELLISGRRFALVPESPNRSDYVAFERPESLTPGLPFALTPFQVASGLW